MLELVRIRELGQRSSVKEPDQAKRKEEEERQKAEADKAAKAASLKTFTASETCLCCKTSQT